MGVEWEIRNGLLVVDPCVDVCIINRLEAAQDFACPGLPSGVFRIVRAKYKELVERLLRDQRFRLFLSSSCECTSLF